MNEETRPTKRTHEPSVPGPESEGDKPMSQRRKLLEAARQLAVSSDSSGDEMVTLSANSVL